MDPFSYVETDRIVELAKTLISKPSVSGEEHALVDWLENYFKYIGLTDVQRLPVEEAGDTLVGWLRGDPDGPTVMLNFHIDTFNAFEGWETEPCVPVVKNRRIYGLGAHDMKGGSACLLTAIEAIVKSGVKLGGNILVTGTTDEENWSRGAHALVNNGILNDVDYCTSRSSLSWAQLPSVNLVATFSTCSSTGKRSTQCSREASTLSSMHQR